MAVSEKVVPADDVSACPCIPSQAKAPCAVVCLLCALLSQNLQQKVVFLKTTRLTATRGLTDQVVGR